ncbi:DUF1934 domain-containing protein [Cytobacillus purgationiresistens]|uniref:Uncharacterized beta-barrel protein YwiB (DUF1934 family) n=1 Tax=Cytobacillus purgationiresistens TaxID=863449 RepID=A0ABU0AKI0_9BACI|nr:DUF1934 domain-containing protein [Cytobacillus purgationiresistens]MDQ0271757.1 uncharacterized beta-barrel protein YwiB (DUF1934 family) [Cytobacillus purgationiresistens]
MSIGPVEHVSVKIKVKTDIRNGKDKETFELTAFGRYYKKDTSRFLQYEEAMEDGKIKTIIKMSDNEALILRSGHIKMRLPLKMNKKLRGSYETPYGVFEMVTLAKRMVHIFEEESRAGSIDLMYEMKMQGSQTGTYHLAITFEEETK